jgi:hypothetical protein
MKNSHCGNQLDVPNRDELWAVLVARHFERLPTEQPHIEPAVRRASDSALAFGGNGNI